MSSWISANIGNIVVLSILVVVVGLVLYKMIRDKKNGKSSCSCGCAGCPMRDKCHK